MQTNLENVILRGLWKKMVGNIMYIIIRQSQKCAIPEKFLTGRERGSKKQHAEFPGINYKQSGFPRGNQEKNKNAIGINIIDFVTTTQVHFAVNTFQCS